MTSKRQALVQNSVNYIIKFHWAFTLKGQGTSNTTAQSMCSCRETNIVLIDNKFKFKIKFNEKDEYSRMSIMCKTVICFKENVDNLSINLCVIPISIQCRQNLLPFPIVSISPPYPFIRYN